MDDPIVLVLVIASAFICAILADGIAGRKNRSATGWFILGFLFSWLALLVVALLPERMDIPAGMGHTTCPRCTAPQNVSLSEPTFECWQCHQITEIEVKR